MGWNLDYRKFRVYLRDKYKIGKAYLFIGFISQHQDLYRSLQQDGYILRFKPVLLNNKSGAKGNVDGDMILQIVRDYYENQFNKAVLVTSDGDFYSTVKFLYETRSLEKVISPHRATCSTLLKLQAKEKIVFIDNLWKKLGYKKKNTA